MSSIDRTYTYRLHRFPFSLTHWSDSYLFPAMMAIVFIGDYKKFPLSILEFSRTRQWWWLLFSYVEFTILTIPPTPAIVVSVLFDEVEYCLGHSMLADVVHKLKWSFIFFYLSYDMHISGSWYFIGRLFDLVLIIVFALTLSDTETEITQWICYLR